MRTTLIIVVSLLTLISGTRQITQQPQTAKTPSLLLSPCNIEGTSEKVSCGTYEVFENRAARTGRKISLKVVVFPSTGKDRAAREGAQDKS